MRFDGCGWRVGERRDGRGLQAQRSDQTLGQRCGRLLTAPPETLCTHVTASAAAPDGMPLALRRHVRHGTLLARPPAPAVC